MTDQPTAPTLVFAGDSITDAGRDRDDLASLGTGYVSLIAAELPGATVVNAGIGGDRARDLEKRWADDVEPHRATTLTVYVGVNETWRAFDQDDPTTPEDFEATYRRLTERSGGARLLLVEPFILPVPEVRDGWLEGERGAAALDDLAGKRAVVAGLARDLGATLVPLHGIMTAAAGADPAALADDGVHPTPAGARLIADAWLDAYRG